MTRTALLALGLVAFVSVAGAGPRRYTLARVLTAPSPGEDAYFGFSVASHGDQLLVSALLEEWVNGAAYLVDPTTGAVLRAFTPPFGTCVRSPPTTPCRSRFRQHPAIPPASGSSTGSPRRSRRSCRATTRSASTRCTT